jgi:hypothetical protein
MGLETPSLDYGLLHLSGDSPAAAQLCFYLL